jgi:hypothetical protein
MNIIVFSVISMWFAHNANSEILTYRITRDNDIKYEKWSKKPIADGYELVSDEQTVILDMDLAQVSWKRRGFDDTNTAMNIGANREGNAITAEGTYKNKSIRKTYPINRNTWTQCAQFYIPSVLKKGLKNTLFWALSIHDMNMYEMEMNVIGREKVTINKSVTDTIRVRINPSGMFGVFWHADLWFQADDFKWIRYESVEGPPGTPPTIKELIDIEMS